MNFKQLKKRREASEKGKNRINEDGRGRKRI